MTTVIHLRWRRPGHTPQSWCGTVPGASVMTEDVTRATCRDCVRLARDHHASAATAAGNRLVEIDVGEVVA